MSERATANRVLLMNTLAFTVCFAVWTLYGVLITFLVDNRYLVIDKGQIGWLIGIPVLTGSVMRLPVGLLTDRYGGKPVYLAVMVFSALSLFVTSQATSFAGFMVGGLLFGMSGASFAVGIAFSSVYFPQERQGTALGIFGMGNAGSAITTLAAPTMLKAFTDGGKQIEGWRTLPMVYGVALLVMAGLFALLTTNRRVEHSGQRSIGEMLSPLRDVRVWRFGLYYFLVFGAFVALAQWLVPYYLNVYGMSLAMAGLLASVFSLPSGVIRALGGWASDKFGARATMYWVLSSCALFFFLLVAPRMEIESPGEGVMAESGRGGDGRTVRGRRCREHAGHRRRHRASGRGDAGAQNVRTQGRGADRPREVGGGRFRLADVPLVAGGGGEARSDGQEEGDPRPWRDPCVFPGERLGLHGLGVPRRDHDGDREGGGL